MIVIMQPTVYSFLLCKKYKDSFRSNCIAFVSESIMTIRKIKFDSSGSCKDKETFGNEIKVCEKEKTISHENERSNKNYFR